MARGNRPTIKDVAARADVSPATVSNVLLGRNAATREVADRVRAAASALGYVADRSASQLRSGKARIVTILVPSLDNPFFTSIVAGLERQVQAENYDIVVASSNERDDTERARLGALLSWRPSGVVVVPHSDDFPNRSELDRLGVPYVVVDRVAAEAAFDSVAIDNRSAASDAATHLLEHGHSNVLVVASTLRLANIRQRCDGVANAFASRGLPPPPVLEGGMTFEAIADRLEPWLSAHGRPSAVLTLTNFATLGVLAHFFRCGMRVPDDVSLVGFDDYAWMRASSPSITAVRQDVDGLTAEAWNILKVRIAGDGSPHQHRVVPCRLVARASVRAVGPPVPSPRLVPEHALPVQDRAAPS